MLTTRPIVVVVCGRVFGKPTDVKTFDEALSDAKYKKVHLSHLQGKGDSVFFESKRRELSRRLAPQASVVKGREVL